MKRTINLVFAALLWLSITACSDDSPTNQIDQYFESIRNDSDELISFLHKMPKGGDIHHHFSGAVYAEQYIANALADSCYINTETYMLYYDKQDALIKEDSSAVLINLLLATSPSEKDSIVDNWSVRNYQERHKNGHDLFFSTFDKFEAAVTGHESELLSELCKKAAHDNIPYIETMIGVDPPLDSIRKYSKVDIWSKDTISITDKLEQLYNYYKSNNIDLWSQMNADSLNIYYERADKHGITLAFQTYGVRVFANHTKTFGRLLLSFETVKLSKHAVGVNFVAPEDNSVALKNYSIHMEMFKFLSEKYPNVNISLHAGELVKHSGSAQDKDLTFHITEALNIAGAKRIGHGVDLVHEKNFESILDYIKANDCAVEINLESNKVILNTDKNTHPLRIYLKHGIPVCIATDDEGVLRTNLTDQYVMLTRYIPEITYEEIKQITYNAVQYSFLDAKSKQSLKTDLDQRYKKFEQHISTLN